MMRDCWLVVVFWLGVSSFLYGYFSTRQEYHLKASPVPSNDFLQQEATIETDRGNASNICASGRRAKYDRLFFVLIDGLRFDQFHEKHFPHLFDLLDSLPTQSLLLPFQADAPTTTSQRLKAIGTGSLPTFIDFSENLHSSEVAEDSWLFQFQHFLQPTNCSDAHNTACDWDKDAIIMGDDTWTKLFPKAFNRQEVFESFNTFDIDSIDDQIFTLLNTTFASDIEGQGNKDWMLWITHFLAIDHLGHSTQDAFHPSISSHLQNYDLVLKDIIPRFPSKTLFILCGDHGMTNNGQHGGSSAEELQSVIFFHSIDTPLLHSSPQSTAEDIPSTSTMNPKVVNDLYVMQQIDLVPTLSVLFDLPIPFSNLGKLLPFLNYHPSTTSECFNTSSILMCDKEIEEYTIYAYYQNVLQIWNYFALYFKAHLEMDWSEVLLRPNEPSSHLKLQDHCQTLLTNQVHDKAVRNIYAGFESSFCKLMSLHKNYLVSMRQVEKHEEEALGSIAIQRRELATQYQQFLGSVQDYMKSQFTQFKYGFITIGMLLMVIAWVVMFWQVKDLLADVIRKLAGNMGQLQRSLYYDPSAVISEDSLTSIVFLVLLMSMIFLVMSTASNSFVVQEKTVVFVTCQLVHLIAAYCEFSRTNHKQPNDNMLWIGHVVILIGNKLISAKYEVKTWILHLILLVISALLWVYNNQLLKITKKRLVLDLLHVCGFLAVLAYYNAGYIFRQLNVHTLFVTLEDLQIDIVHLIWSLVFVQLVGLGVSGIELYHQQKSSSMQILKVAQVFLQVLLLYAGSETHAWTILMNFLALIFTTLYLYWRKIDSSIEEVKILGISLYLLFACRNVFYQTSHGLSFDQLQLSVGFIGQKTFQFYYAGFALALNTFSSEVLLVLFFAMIPRNFKLAMRFNLILRMSMVLMSAVVAFVLRRHLMVWAIFAPKLLFEVAMFLIFSFLSIPTLL